MDPEKKPLTEEELKELFEDALTDVEDTNKTRIFKKQTDVDRALMSTVKEFLNAFALIGYDLKGNPIIIQHAKTPLDRNALKMLLFKYFPYMVNEEL